MRFREEQLSLAELHREPEQFDWDLHYLGWLEAQSWAEAQELEEVLRKLEKHLSEDPFWDE